MNNEKQSVSKGRKIAGFVLLSIVAAVFLYCLAVMISRLATYLPEKRSAAVPRFMAEFGFACIFALPALDLIFGIFTWRKNKALRITGIAVRVISIAVCVVFLTLFSAVVITGTIKDEGEPQNVCVLGLALTEKDLPRDLIHRLDTAIEYKNSHPETRFITTGGNSEDPEKTESAVMIRYLLEHGFENNEKLVSEPKAKTTIQNFKYVGEMVGKTQPLGVVTSDLHMFRATRIAKKQGYTKIIKIPAPSEPATYLENASWEAICLIFSLLGGSLVL